MSKKILPIAVLALILIFTASAAWIEPLDCNKLDSNVVEPKTEFASPGDICFYGTGYENENVIIKLGSYTIESPITKGILTSLNGYRFINIPEGEYTLRVYTSEEDFIEYPNPIIVSENGHAEVPEFSTFGMITVVTLAGLFIALRRRS